MIGLSNIEKALNLFKDYEKKNKIVLKMPEDREIIENIIFALKKQIPQKPHKEESKLLPYQYLCPHGCGLHNERVGEPYCSNCGQKLNWNGTG